MAAKKDKEVEPVVIEAPDLPLEEVEVISAPKGAREARWAKFLDDYKVLNPVKFAAKKANGEFNSIPESFQ